MIVLIIGLIFVILIFCMNVATFQEVKDDIKKRKLKKFEEYKKTPEYKEEMKNKSKNLPEGTYTVGVDIECGVYNIS